MTRSTLVASHQLRQVADALASAPPDANAAALVWLFCSVLSVLSVCLLCVFVSFCLSLKCCFFRPSVFKFRRFVFNDHGVCFVRFVAADVPSRDESQAHHEQDENVWQWRSIFKFASHVPSSNESEFTRNTASCQTSNARSPKVFVLPFSHDNSNIGHYRRRSLCLF